MYTGAPDRFKKKKTFQFSKQFVVVERNIRYKKWCKLTVLTWANILKSFQCFVIFSIKAWIIRIVSRIAVSVIGCAIKISWNAYNKTIVFNNLFWRSSHQTEMSMQNGSKMSINIIMNVTYHLCRRYYGIQEVKFGTNPCHKRISYRIWCILWAERKSLQMRLYRYTVHCPRMVMSFVHSIDLNSQTFPYHYDQYLLLRLQLEFHCAVTK